MTKTEAALKLIDIAAGVDLIGSYESAEAIRMGAKALSAPPTVLMGYRIEELQVLAELLRDQYVSPITVSRLVNDASYMYQLVSEAVLKDAHEAQKAVLKDAREAQKHIKLSPWKEEKEGQDE